MLKIPIEYDDAKNRANIEKHGISFESAKLMNDSLMYVEIDDRKHYIETRYRGYGHIMGRLHMVIFTMRGVKMRIISLRKTNGREDNYYESKKNSA